MASATALLELGDRYWALGLPAAAKSALHRAMAQSDDAAPALRLTEIALAQGDAAGARKYAAEAAKRAPGPSTRILLGRAQLAAGELAAARMSLGAALDAPKLAPWDRARAHLELARAAEAQGDAAGAGAQASAAFEASLTAAQQQVTHDALTLLEEVAAAVVAHGRAADAVQSLETAKPTAGRGMCAAALLSARQAAGEGSVTDAAIEAELAAVEEAQPSAAIKLRRLERRARKHGSIDRDALAGELEALIHAAAGEPMPAVDRARLWFLLASLCADEPRHARPRRGRLSQGPRVPARAHRRGVPARAARCSIAATRPARSPRSSAPCGSTRAMASPGATRRACSTRSRRASASSSGACSTRRTPAPAQRGRRGRAAPGHRDRRGRPPRRARRRLRARPPREESPRHHRRAHALGPQARRSQGERP